MRTRRQDRTKAETESVAADSGSEMMTASKSASPAATATTTAISLKKVETKTKAVPVPESTTAAAALPAELITSGPHDASLKNKMASKLPPQFQFPLVVVLNLAFSALSHALAYPLVKGVLAPNERPLQSWNETAMVVGWKVVELALGWFGGYDGYDIAALSLLSNGPPLYLLFAFFEMPAFSLLSYLTIETLSTFIPFRLLRPLSTVHSDPASNPNGEIITDRPIALLATLLAGAIYSVTLFAAYASYLPPYLVTGFNELKTVEPAHTTFISLCSTYMLLPVTLALGFASYILIFTPAEAIGRTQADAVNEGFDPVAADLGETVWWNIWGWSDQTKTVMRRTALVCLVTGVNGFLQTRLTITGVETSGALAWAGAWVFAGLFTGVGLGAVGSV